jgi:serine protease Do
MIRQTKLTGAVLVFVLSSAAVTAWAQRPYRGGPASANLRDGREVRSAFRTLVADASQSTVRVVCDGKETVLGTIVGEDGWIVTKFSELREPVTCRLSDGRHFPARVVGEDPGYDLAMLKIDATELKPVAWNEDENGPAVGQLLATVSDGGELPREIGVVSVPLRKIPPEGRLGIAFAGSDDSATISVVDPLSAAQRAGIRVGDVVIRAAEKPINSRQELIDLIRQHKPGDTIALVVHRGDKDIDITATLRTDMSGRSDRMNRMGSQLSKRSTDFPSVIQHDTALMSSDCGGPLVDLSGKVVGINIARGGRTETYAAPASRVRLLLADLETGKLAVVDPLPGAVLVNADHPADKTASRATVGDAPAPENSGDTEQSKAK